jgi:hypothetical protein
MRIISGLMLSKISLGAQDNCFEIVTPDDCFSIATPIMIIDEGI